MALSPCAWIALLLFLQQSLELSIDDAFLAVFEAFPYFEGGFNLLQIVLSEHVFQCARMRTLSGRPYVRT